MKHASELKNIYVSILLLGIVSLMGDIVYEGSRGLIPGYLKFLGATAFIVGLISGLGEFLGYAVRLLSGFLADTTRAYWVFMFLGYGLIVSIPLLGFTNGWEIAAILVLLERLGKACRSPSRDTILSIVSGGVGAGKAFGIHEFLDQVGAVMGPLIVATLMLYSSNNYRWTFNFLIIPFTMLLTALVFTYWKIGSRIAVEPKTAIVKGRILGRLFYIYTLAVVLNTIGLVPASLILYKVSMILQPEQQQWMVPLIYLLIQGIDAPAALLSGYLYDKFGIKILVLPFILSVFPPLFTMVNSDLTALIVASVFFGIVLGVQESTYRAAVSEFTPLSSRGTAYGVFNATYGFGFLISGGIYGLIIDL
ncbi:MFS transporter [Candidatus Bathyarchaeota archaeon]|nr:MFS transporter [Candidatus Bathyarchaeota archaeon]